MPKENKSTEIEYEARIAKVFELLVRGVLDRDMWQHVSKIEGWEISKRQVDRYLGDANELFKIEGEKHKEREFGKARMRYDMLFEKSLKIQDYKTCLAIQKEVSALFGLVTSKLDIKINKLGLDAIDTYED